MGDFAVGKLIDQVTFDPVVVAEFDQFVADVDGHPEAADAGFSAPPAEEGAVADLTGLIVPGTPSELLLCLMQWHNGGFYIYDYQIHSAEQIIADARAGVVQEGCLVIGHDLDEELLILHTGDGAVQTGAELSGEDLSQYLGRFRFELCGNRIEWAEPWVQKA